MIYNIALNLAHLFRCIRYLDLEGRLRIERGLPTMMSASGQHQTVDRQIGSHQLHES